MTGNGKMGSALLKDELVRIDLAIQGQKEDEAAALVEIRSLARAAVAADGKDALAQCRAAEAKLGQAKMGIRRLYDAKQQVEIDLAAALAEEDQAAREADAKEATAFAESLPNVYLDLSDVIASGSALEFVSHSIGVN
jgi:hypothetical protein